MTKRIFRPLRRASRQLLFAAVGALVIGLVMQWSNATGDDDIMNFGPSSTLGVSLGAAFAAYMFLALALLVGPWHVLRKRPIPVSSYLRRDFGIWAAAFALFHTVVGLQVIPRASMWAFFFYPGGERPLSVLRFDFFGVANHLGLIAALVVLFLLCLSSDFALRRLQVKRWKNLQRWVYPAAVIILIHGVMYQSMWQRTWGFIILFLVISLAAIAGQLGGIYMRRRRANRPPEGRIEG